MLVYPAPVRFAEYYQYAAKLFGDLSASYPAPPGQAQAFCTLPTIALDYMQPVQAYMHPGMVFCSSFGESGELIPAGFQSAPNTSSFQPAGTPPVTQKKRRRGGGQRGKGKVAMPGEISSEIICSNAFENPGSSPTSQASPAFLSLANSNSSQPAPKEKYSRSKSKKTEKQEQRREEPSKSIKPSTGIEDSNRETRFVRSNVICDDIKAFGEDIERCEQIIAQLETQGSAARSAFKLLLPNAKALAISKQGTRVVQKAIEVGDAEEKIKLLEQLQGNMIGLYKSPHGNHVVAKIIEVMNPKYLTCILDELEGSWLAVARHQYGCRLLERLLEHCPPDKVAAVVEELLRDAHESEALCRHPMGNFVVQHIFEHGQQAWKDRITEHMVKGPTGIPGLAKHRTASHVVQMALKFGGKKVQLTLVSSLVNSKKNELSLVDLGCSRYGSFVVEELASIEACSAHVRQLLCDGLTRLAEDQYGKRAVSKFGISPGLCGLSGARTL